MTISLKPSAKTFQYALRELGFDNKVTELPESTRTAKEAAAAIGCDVGQIAKSIIFKLELKKAPILIIACGTNRINEKTVENIVEDVLKKADAAYVKERTGYAIGGVPPIGHSEKIVTLLDEDLFQYDIIWAAAGHAKAIFKTSPNELAKMTGAKIVNVL